ncbi:ABC transporter permease [Miniphocaeibacter massiliensis]|uniref:ABC transporter permease n=1 Tax=Miniphocaeibacter massiliensis TaxID=2041841 RepID=UPI000C1BD601|nr:ABC transporter permease [Miniphocaeibacter massiliensis]
MYSTVKTTKKEPLIRIVKKEDIGKANAIIIRVVAILLALLTGGLLMLILGKNPIEIYSSMVNGAFDGKIRIQETIKVAIPLLVAGIGVSYAFKMKFWNIGGEGQILMGGIAATAIVVYGESIPKIPKLILMFFAAIIAGGLYGSIPAFFKSKWNTNETLFTLMLNYIALQFVRLLQYRDGWQAQGTTFPKIRNFTMDERLPKILGVHIGWIIALVIVIISYIYLNKTKQGYEISVVGGSENTAKYAGMNVGKIFIRTMFISAALCGIVGFLQVAGADGTLTENTAGGDGFTAITVAWMSHLNPFIMVLMSLFIAFLERGASNIQTTHGIPASMASVLTGIILFFMLGSEFFINYKVIFRKKVKEE